MVSYNSESSLTIYLRKQKKFLKLVESIHTAIRSKEYRKHGYTFNSYVKKNWNISKAQAYRYLISAKILDQLKEFKILPNYERLCKTISNITKTEEQVKLLWKTVLRKVENRLDEISTSFITNVWKELCHDKKYDSICHVEKNMMKKNENSENEYSESKLFNEIEFNSKIIFYNDYENVSNSKSFISSPSYIENNTSINNNASSQVLYVPSPSYTESDLQSSNDNFSQNSYFPSPSNTETDILINDITSQNSLFAPLSTLDNSQQLDINSQLIINPSNDQNDNNSSQVDSIPQVLSYYSLNNINNNTNEILTSSINQSNNNSEVLYYSVPVTVVNSSNNIYYSIDDNQSYIQTIPMTSSPTTIYYMVNTPTKQPILISSLPSQQAITY